jgi:anti-sigma regulatory factor (Ser/Thr protein kinase)
VAVNALGTGSVLLPVHDSSNVAEVRRAVAALAGDAGFSEAEVGRASLVASEMATNLFKHAGDGFVVVRPIAQGIELMAIDRGPGMSDPMECLRDGFSTAGSAGTGLGAIKRMSDDFDLFTQPGIGTVVLGRLRNRECRPVPPGRFMVGAVSLPMDGQTVCGDGWSSREEGDAIRLVVFDGLGHGPDAASATEAAMDLVTDHPDEGPAALLQRVHHGIRHTRGAAGMVCDISSNGQAVRFAGVGNISIVLVHDYRARPMMSHNGTLGHNASRFQELTQPWAHGDQLILYSDGLTSRWDLARYPGLQQRDPAVMAAVLWRDFQRGRDDATVVVIRER